MANTHAYPDSFYELQATFGDLGPQVIVSHSGLTVPASSLTMPGVSANGYVLSPGPPARLVYVSQPAVSVTLSATNGPWWLALHADLHTPVSGWTRRSGSHYLVQQAATQPANPSGGLVFAQVTVSGGVITAVSPLLPVTSAPMSKQNSNAVAITGGNVQATRLGVGVAVPGTDGQARINATLGVGRAPHVNIGVAIQYASAANQYGLMLTPALGGAATPVVFTRWDGAVFTGSITTTDTSTAYNTSSDIRLKHAITPLTDALDRVRALRPVSFRWNADDSPGDGFLAHELMKIVPMAVSGLPDEVNPDGSIKPQQIDHSKLIPHLTAGIKELLAMVESLTARVATLEQALGL